MSHPISYFRSFFEILVKPGETFKTLVAEDPGYGKWVVVPIYSALGGINPTFYLLFLKVFPSWAALLAETLLMTAVGIFFFWIAALLNFLVGKWLGGKGTLGEVATAYAWAYVPCFAALFLIRLSEIPKWTAILGGETDLRVILETGRLLVFLALLPSMPFFIWSMVLMVFGISEAHRISRARALGVMGILLGLGLLVGGVTGVVVVFMILRNVGH